VKGIKVLRQKDKGKQRPQKRRRICSASGAIGRNSSPSAAAEVRWRNVESLAGHAPALLEAASRSF
jgi:hypothetical protein